MPPALIVHPRVTERCEDRQKDIASAFAGAAVDAAIFISGSPRGIETKPLCYCVAPGKALRFCTRYVRAVLPDRSSFVEVGLPLAPIPLVIARAAAVPIAAYANYLDMMRATCIWGVT